MFKGNIIPYPSLDDSSRKVGCRFADATYKPSGVIPRAARDLLSVSRMSIGRRPAHGTMTGSHSTRR
jgi:hypothetical protein